MTKSAEHNSRLCAEAVAKSGVHSRFPRVSEQVECLTLGLESLPKHAYNPSILRNGGKLWMTYRYHFGGDARTRLGICQLGDGGKVVKSADLPISAFSVEDARLFSLHGEPWMSWVESQWEGKFENPRCITKYAQLESYLDPLEPDEEIRRNQVLMGFKINRQFQVKAGGNDMSSMQKNWCFFESDENLFCIFESWPEQIVFQIKGDAVINEYRTKEVKWPYGPVRGGTIVPYDSKLLRFFHSATDYGIGRPEHRYFVGAAILESKPPFATIAISRKPVLYGSESDNFKSAERKAIHHWKESVAFPTGAIVDGDNFILAVGVNDCACALVRIKPEMLNL